MDPFKEGCALGRLLNEHCHLTWFTKEKGYTEFQDYTDQDKELLILRSGIDATHFHSQGVQVCHHHSKVFLSKYEFSQRKCCNPFSKHTKNIKTGLKPVNIEFVRIVTEKCANLGLNIKPGQKLCVACRDRLNELIKHVKCEPADTAVRDASVSDDDNDSEFEKAQQLEDLNANISPFGCSPVKLHGVHVKDKKVNLQRKAQKITSMKNVLHVEADVMILMN